MGAHKCLSVEHLSCQSFGIRSLFYLQYLKIAVLWHLSVSTETNQKCIPNSTLVGFCLLVLVGVLSQTPSSEDEVFVRKNTDKGKDLLGCGPDESGELKVVR